MIDYDNSFTYLHTWTTHHSALQTQIYAKQTVSISDAVTEKPGATNHQLQPLIYLYIAIRPITSQSSIETSRGIGKTSAKQLK
jgi:hypothetical protein